VDACNPLLQAHPTWAQDKHEGRGISTSLSLSRFGCLSSPLRALSHADPSGLGHAATFHSSAQGPPGLETPTGSEHGEDPPNAVMQRLAESAARVVTQGLQATLGGASRGDVVKTKDLAEGRDSLGHGHAVGLLLLSRLGKCLGGLVEGRLEPCKQPKQKSSNTS
jgi:hypothetical protein